MEINYQFITRFLSTLIILLLFSSIDADADSVRKLINKGNAAYADGQYNDALSAYEEASVERPESPYIYFNKGTVLYQKGDYDGAKEAFEKAALKSRDIKLEAQSKFNIGNSFFHESERQRGSDLSKSLAACEKSIRYYQEALKLLPKFQEAAENIEIARLTMKSILDEIKKQEEAAKKQQGERQNAEKKPKPQNDESGQQKKEQREREEKEQGQAKHPLNQNEKKQKNPDDSAQEKEKQKTIAQFSDEARDILEEEKENQLRRGLPSAGGYVAVEKDW